MLQWVEERDAILTEQDELLIEDVRIDPTNLPCRPVVWYEGFWFFPLNPDRSLLPIDGDALCIENFTYIVECGNCPTTR